MTRVHRELELYYNCTVRMYKRRNKRSLEVYDRGTSMTDDRALMIEVKYQVDRLSTTVRIPII